MTSSRWFPVAIAVVILGLVATLILLAAGTFNLAEAALAVAVIFLIALLAVATGADLLDLLRRIKKLPGGIEFYEAAQKAASETPEGAAENEPEDLQPSKSLQDLRLKLQAKMTYIAERMLPSEPGHARSPSIGSLRYDGYITDAQARTLDWVTIHNERDLTALTKEERTAALRDADKVITNIRASVLNGLVRERLRQLGADFEEIDRGDRRPDLLVTTNGKRWRLAVAFAVSEGSSVLDAAVKRLAHQDAEPPFDHGLVVVPQNSRAITAEGSEPRVVKVGELDTVLVSS